MHAIEIMSAFLGKKAERASHLLPNHECVPTTGSPKTPSQLHYHQYGACLKRIVFNGGATEGAVRKLHAEICHTNSANLRLASHPVFAYYFSSLDISSRAEIRREKVWSVFLGL